MRHAFVPAAAQQALRGLVWGRVPPRAGAFPRVLAVLAALAALFAAAGNTASEAAGAPVSVVVRKAEGTGDAPERLVGALHGTVDRRLGIINGFTAKVPRAQLERLRAAPGVASVTVNGRVQLHGFLDGWEHTNDLGSMYYVAQEVTGAGDMWNDGQTGRGVDIALIDSGVAPVEGLLTPGKVINGPDLSFESQSDNLRYLDTYGHGTHMAGIIAGRDRTTPTTVRKGEESFVGMAPDARIVSVKVADSHGLTDVSQVIAAIDWVVQHRRDNGMNIRVLNLSFGTDSEQDYRLDPLAYAAEVAWRKGIVVVVAAGNGGSGIGRSEQPCLRSIRHRRRRRRRERHVRLARRHRPELVELGVAHTAA